MVASTSADSEFVTRSRLPHCGFLTAAMSAGAGGALPFPTQTIVTAALERVRAALCVLHVPHFNRPTHRTTCTCACACACHAHVHVTCDLCMYYLEQLDLEGSRCELTSLLKLPKPS
eukprot:3271331-Prymnesium_polylepis.1